jgi:capsular exopolysaccharide synthesis family protein
MKESPGLIKKVTEIWDVEELEEKDGPSPAAGHDGQDDAEDAPHLREYWRSLRRYRLLILGITLIGTLLATLYMARQPDIYEAEARVQVDLENNPALGSSKSGSVIVSNPINDPAYFNTQLEILTGSGLLRRVVKTLDLEHNQAFRRSRAEHDTSMTWQNLRRMVGLGAKDSSDERGRATDEVLLPRSVAPATASDDLAEAKRLAPYVRALQSRLSVEPVKKAGQAVKETRLIDISFTHPDPQIAAKVVNAITNTLVLSNLERKTETNATAGDFLQQRVAELQTQIRHDEEQLINYAKDHQILSLEPGQNTVAERLAGLNKQLMEAENERIMAEVAYRASLVPGAANAMAEEADKRAAGPIAKLEELRQRRAQLLVEVTEEWPEVKEINGQIAVLEKQIEEARGRAVSAAVAGLETRYRQALAREQTLRAAFEQQRGEMLAQNEAAINYRIIQQEIETNKSLLDGLLQRSKENEVVLNGTPNNIHVVDHALVPEAPIGPKRLRNVGLISVFSLGFGVALALFLSYLDDSIRSVDDVERMLRLPALAIIPTVGGSKLLPVAGARHKQNGNGHRQALIIDADARSPLTETYRHLRTSVLLSTAGRAPKILLVASSEPNEGKTTIATNVALSLAQTGAAVLIIDADLRRPRLHAIFELQNQRGLTTILSGEADETQVLSLIQQHAPGKLHILPAGPAPPNPAELLGSEQMRGLVATLASAFDFIVIDSPPIAAFTDSVLIASMVDGVLLVIRGGKSSREIARRSQKMLREVGTRILGVVLNNVKLRSYEYYYQQSYYQQTYYKSADQSVSGARR